MEKMIISIFAATVPALSVHLFGAPFWAVVMTFWFCADSSTIYQYIKEIHTEVNFVEISGTPLQDTNK